MTHEDPDRRPERADGREDEDVAMEDRLLAHALGLEDDPGLDRELERSPELRRRLDHIVADLDAVERGLDDAVPPPSDEWADLSDSRWDRLRPFVSVQERETADAAPRDSRSAVPFWRHTRTIVPTVVAALLAVVVIGVITGREDSQLLAPGGDGAEMSKGLSDEDAAAPGEERAAGLAVAGAGAYDTVVVADAGVIADGRQEFTVVGTLKGEAPQPVVLETGPGGSLAPGTRALLFLEPVGGAATGGAPTVAWDDTAGGTAGQADSAAAPTEAERSYTYEGGPAAILELPAGADPADLRLR